MATGHGGHGRGHGGSGFFSRLVKTCVFNAVLVLYSGDFFSAQLFLFGSTYKCEASFSTLTYAVNKYRSRIDVSHELRVSLSEVIPDQGCANAVRCVRLYVLMYVGMFCGMFVCFLYVRYVCGVFAACCGMFAACAVCLRYVFSRQLKFLGSEDCFDSG